jgi:hypothetical protein
VHILAYPDDICGIRDPIFRELGDGDKPFNAVNQLDEDIILGNLADFAGIYLAYLELVSHGQPRIGLGLPEGERDFFLFWIHFQHEHFHVITYLHDL